MMFSLLQQTLSNGDNIFFKIDFCIFYNFNFENGPLTTSSQNNNPNACLLTTKKLTFVMENFKQIT